MNIIDAIILGLVQGLTEFIPVSSSGHLILFHDWLNVDLATHTGFLFDMALNIGTLSALVIYFHKDIIKLTKAAFNKSSKEYKLAWLLALATLPAVVAGLLLKESAESTFRSPKLVAMNLIVVAVFMLFAEWYSLKSTSKAKLNDVSVRQALSVGVAQAVALVPGVSRSGATITTGVLTGVDRVAATRFSFLLGIPIMLGALLSTLLSDSALSSIKNESDIFVAGIIAAFVSGIFAIQFLLKYLSKHGLHIFAYYRIGLGILVLAFAFLR